MRSHQTLATGLAVGLTCGLTYLLCALATRLFPTLLADALGVLVHGLNVDALGQAVPPMRFWHVAAGAAFFTLTGLWVGALYAGLANTLRVLRVAR